MERMKDRPFVALGVATDTDTAQARKGVEQFQLPWRSWWDGGVNGPVSRTWQVPGLPYAVLIDPRGVVRHRGMAGPALEAAIDRMMQEQSPKP
ncbi:MAG: hypothetical protein U0736_06345 [Gemmataceae bacterium]